MPEDKEEKIKVFDADDKSLNSLGELLSKPSSRSIIKFLIEKPSYKNEIADKLSLDPSTVDYHLKKLLELGVIKITNKPIARKGIKHKHYKMIPNLFIRPDQSKEEIEKKETLKKIFKEGTKIIMIPFSGAVSWLLVSNTIFIEKNWKFSDPHHLSNEFLSSTIISLIVVIGALLVYVKFKK